MSQVHGVGEAKLAQYGEIFLEVIRQHVAAHHAAAVLRFSPRGTNGFGGRFANVALPLPVC